MRDGTSSYVQPLLGSWKRLGCECLVLTTCCTIRAAQHARLEDEKIVRRHDRERSICGRKAMRLRTGQTVQENDTCETKAHDDLSTPILDVTTVCARSQSSVEHLILMQGPRSPDYDSTATAYSSLGAVSLSNLVS
jgi:hypothetical protein